MRALLRALAVCLLLALALPAQAEAKERSAPTHFALGATSVVSTFIYGTVKVGYAVLGTMIGGLAYVTTGGRRDVARAIIQPAIRGDYIVSPEHLTGERALVFAGRDPEYSAIDY